LIRLDHRHASASCRASAGTCYRTTLEQTYRLKSFDALHVACALAAGAHLFVTTDDFILKKLKLDTAIRVVNPVEALSILENWYAN
jgi:predicted nucleic acid-binding protein